MMRSSILRIGVWPVVAAIALLAGCADPEGENPDAGSDAGDASESLEVELGRRIDPAEHDPLPDSGAVFEIISGFQGGYHIEPTLRMKDPGPDEFITLIDYELIDPETGEEVTMEPSRYRGNEAGWTRVPPDSYVRTYQQFILDTFDPEELVGRSFELRVRVEVEDGGGTGSDSAMIELVDEVDELR